MISTRIENKLKSRFYNLFWKRFDHYADEIWQAKLIQCIEQNVHCKRLYCIAPNRYLVTVGSGMFVTEGDKDFLVKKIRDFVYNYCKDVNYQIADKISIDIITNGKNDENIKFCGWVKNVSESNIYINVVIRDIERNNYGLKFVNLPLNSKSLAGRAETANIRLDHKFVSDFHARILVNESGNVKIRDLQSLNGSYLDGRRLEPHRLYELELPALLNIGGVYEVNIRKKSVKPQPELLRKGE